MGLERILVYVPEGGILPSSLGGGIIPRGGLHRREVDVETYRMPITEARNILVKAGSDVLRDNEGGLDKEAMCRLADQMVALRRKGCRVTYVTSGARMAGEEKVGGEIAAKAGKAELCAIGQSRLQGMYEQIFDAYRDIEISQHLLTDMDFEPPHNVYTRMVLDGICSLGGIPIINANDATWGGETLRDNDALAADLCNLLGIELAINLTNVDGVIKGYNGKSPVLINWVMGFGPGLYKYVEDIESPSGTGGMADKLVSMEKILSHHLNSQGVIVNGKQPNVILDILAGRNIGTWFYRPRPKR